MGPMKQGNDYGIAMNMGEEKFALVDVADIGHAVASIFSKSSDYINKHVAIASD